VTTRSERLVRGKSTRFLAGLAVLLVLAWGAASAVDWLLARWLPLWLFAVLAMATFAISNTWCGWRKATRKRRQAPGPDAGTTP
jgi:hypothetical protein